MGAHPACALSFPSPDRMVDFVVFIVIYWSVKRFGPGKTWVKSAWPDALSFSVGEGVLRVNFPAGGTACTLQSDGWLVDGWFVVLAPKSSSGQASACSISPGLLSNVVSEDKCR